jgi:predicted transcriptional regulator
MRTKGTAEFTTQMSVACTPAMKQQLKEAAAAREVNPSVIARWAVSEWLAAHETTQTEETG